MLYDLLWQINRCDKCFIRISRDDLYWFIMKLLTISNIQYIRYEKLKSAVVYHDDTSKNININTTHSPTCFFTFQKLSTLSHEKILEQIYPNNPCNKFSKMESIPTCNCEYSFQPPDENNITRIRFSYLLPPWQLPPIVPKPNNTIKINIMDIKRQSQQLQVLTYQPHMNKSLIKILGTFVINLMSS